MSQFLCLSKTKAYDWYNSFQNSWQIVVLDGLQPLQLMQNVKKIACLVFEKIFGLSCVLALFIRIKLNVDQKHYLILWWNACSDDTWVYKFWNASKSTIIGAGENELFYIYVGCFIIINSFQKFNVNKEYWSVCLRNPPKIVEIM